MIRVKSLHYSVPLIFSFHLQGIRQIHIGTKLQEVGSQCQYKGWTFLYYAMAGTNMSYLQDMCSKLFREIKEDELVPGQFDSPPTKSSMLRWKRKRSRLVRLLG